MQEDDHFDEHDYSYSHMYNPFTHGEAETTNNPSLTQFLETSYNEEEDEDHDAMLDDASHISLNLSIDTLARVKPVDMTNEDLFLQYKEYEEQHEEGIRHIVEQQDAEEEELSPHSKTGKRTVLYDSFMEQQDSQRASQSIQTEVSFNPAQRVQYEVNGQETHIFDPSFHHDLDLVETPKSHRTHIDSPEDVSFVSPIAKFNTPMQRQIMTPNFMSPIANTKSNDMAISPDFGLTPIRKDEFAKPKKRDKVVKQLSFTQKSQEDALPIHDAIKQGMITTSRGQFADMEETGTSMRVKFLNSLLSYHCDHCHSNVSLYSATSPKSCHVCHARVYPESFNDSLLSLISESNVSLYGYKNDSFSSPSKSRKPLSPSGYEYIKKRFYSNLNWR